jgi:hypothetical protein
VVRGVDHYLNRVTHLRQINMPWEVDRTRIRRVMNGGAEAVEALLGDNRIGNDLTTVNLLESGLTRLAQKLGMPPSVKVPPPLGKESQRSRDKAGKRQRLVNSYDDLAQIDMQLPQIARWMPGYGFFVWVHKATEYDGEWYPTTELRDPFDCWPGWYGPDQHPAEIGFVRQAEIEWVAAMYPPFAEHAKKIKNAQVAADIWTPQSSSSPYRSTYDASWEGKPGMVTLVEYYDVDGMTLVVPGYGMVLEHTPNPLSDLGILPFTFRKRFSFDRLKGQYDGMIGMMAMMAKLNILALIASEDAVFRETNVIGEMEGTSYQRGRFATNYFQPGTRIERPGGDVAFGVFQQIDRIERQMRIQGQYSVIEDSQSPNSFVTGRGLDSLTASADQNVNEYQRVISRGLEHVDRWRLAWDERHTASGYKKKMPSAMTDEEYRPSTDIAGRYHTKRMYGVMAGWDEPQKIVTGLQLIQGGIIDIETMQENLSGIDDPNQIRERIRRDGAEQQLVAALAQRAQQGDPQAMMVLVEIYQSPDKMEDVLVKFFTPQEPMLSPEEMMMMQGMGQPGMTAPNSGPPPSVTTVLSQLGAGGETEGGVQTASTIRR